MKLLALLVKELMALSTKPKTKNQGNSVNLAFYNSVAIKKFKESDEDELARKTILREVKMLRMLKHKNLKNDQRWVSRLFSCKTEVGPVRLFVPFVGAVTYEY